MTSATALAAARAAFAATATRSVIAKAEHAKSGSARMEKSKARSRTRFLADAKRSVSKLPSRRKGAARKVKDLAPPPPVQGTLDFNPPPPPAPILAPAEITALRDSARNSVRALGIDILRATLAPGGLKAIPDLAYRYDVPALEEACKQIAARTTYNEAGTFAYIEVPVNFQRGVFKRYLAAGIERDGCLGPIDGERIGHTAEAINLIILLSSPRLSMLLTLERRLTEVFRHVAYSYTRRDKSGCVQEFRYSADHKLHWESVKQRDLICALEVVGGPAFHAIDQCSPHDCPVYLLDGVSVSWPEQVLLAKACDRAWRRAGFSTTGFEALPSLKARGSRWALAATVQAVKAYAGIEIKALPTTDEPTDEELGLAEAVAEAAA